MTVVLAQWRWSAHTGESRDRMVNTFHFLGGGTDYSNIVDLLTDFWTQPGTSYTNITDHMSGSVMGTTAECIIYDLEDETPRHPVHAETITALDLGGGVGNAAQVACCLSFEAAGVSGVNQNRRRNRIYIPGLATNQMAYPGQFDAALLDDIVRSAHDLKVAADSSVSWNWVVYSPSTVSGGDVETGALAIDDIWVDSSPDIQRRRKQRATSRLRMSDLF